MKSWNVPCETRPTVTLAAATRMLRSRVLLPPAAAEDLVQGHPIALLGEARRDQSLARGIVAALGIEYLDIAVAAHLVASLGGFVSVAGRLDQGRLGRAPAIQGGEYRQSIGHFTKAGPNGLLILRQRDLFVDVRGIQAPDQ